MTLAGESSFFRTSEPDGSRASVRSVPGWTRHGVCRERAWGRSCDLAAFGRPGDRPPTDRDERTGADRTWAERYEVGDVLRYSRASKQTGIGKGEYAQVKSIDSPKNRLTVELQDGTQRTYEGSLS